MRIFDVSTMVGFANEVGVYAKSVPKNTMQINKNGANGLIILQYIDNQALPILQINNYNPADPTQRISDSAGVADASVLAAVARLNTFFGN